MKDPNGSFTQSKSLNYIHIPMSVEKIGPYAFIGSSLPTVQISPYCDYKPNSFEDECIVTFYPITTEE